MQKIIIEDLKDLFVKEYVYPMIRGHALYEGNYLLGTSIARPLIAKKQIEIAKNLLLAKVDISIIIQTTGLTENEIKELKCNK